MPCVRFRVLIVRRRRFKDGTDEISAFGDFVVALRHELDELVSTSKWIDAAKARINVLQEVHTEFPIDRGAMVELPLMSYVRWTLLKGTLYSENQV